MTTDHTSGPAVGGAASLIGQHLGSYQIEALLGRGGMAAVYQALDTRLQRRVAIKVLDPAAAQSDFRERFLQEAQLIAGLRHPNIVQVYDLGEHQGTPYMVQELLPGPTLEQRLRDNAARGARLAPEEVLAIVRQLAAALDAAHAAGIIHRDVKPANAIWNRAGTLVLTDFGIAKLLRGAANQTQAGTIFGTPNYLSPEQAQGLPLSPASDVYALGVVLYELLVGRPPFASAISLSVLADHVHTPPPPIDAQALGLPADVDVVVQQALAKQPGARFLSAGALLRALEQAWSQPRPLAAADIHSQPTSVYTVPSAAFGATIAHPVTPPAAPPVAAPVPMVAPATLAPARPPAPPASPLLPAAAPTASPRRNWLLPLIGGALLLLFLAGVAFAARGAADPTAPTAEPAPAATLVGAQPTQAAPPAPTTPPAPTELPAQPTTAPAPAEEPVAAPVEEPVATDPIGELRALFAANAGGRDGKTVRELQKTLDEVDRAIAKGDSEQAADKLSELQKQLLAGAEKQELDPALVEQGLAGVETIAAAYGLSLAPRGEGDEGSWV